MSADLVIRVVEPPCTDDDVKWLMSRVLGSKYFNMANLYYSGSSLDDPRWNRVFDTPSVWVGEVSFLKAALYENGEENFVPPAVRSITEIVGEDFPVLDERMRDEILGSFEQPNSTGYELNDRGTQIKTFLDLHMGKCLFTVAE